ncbi:MAG: T9SS type A sorting domain-containing protein, partial [Mucilaginibacter sp.]
WATRTVYPYIAPENVTLTSTGNMNVGPYTFKDWYTPASANIGYTGSGGGTNSAVRGFNMLGNPYPCAIDWGTAYSGATGIVRTNVAPTIWVFNPVTYQYDTYLSTSATTGTATGNASRYIASGQGFIVQATTTSPSLTIDEYSKVVVNANATVGTGAVPAAAQLTGSNLLMGKPVQDPVTQLIRLKLAADSINYDDIVVGFNSTASTKYNTDEDAKYIPGLNAAEGLASFSADNVRLSINFLPLPKQTQQEIKLHVTGNNSGTYTFKRTELNAIPQIYDVWLMDKYKKDSLDMRSNKTYAFNINLADTSSFGNNRFSIVIRQNPVLGVHLINFTATKAAGASQIRWVTENEQNYTNFTVERSTDGGTTFNVLGGVPSRGVGNYSLLDNQPVTGSNMYRLKIEDLNNNITYSNVITLIYSGDNRPGSDNIVIYPNPAKSTISLTLDPAVNPNLLKSDKFAAAGNLFVPSINPEYNIVITSTAGTVVKTETTTQKDWQANVSRLLPGTYIIQVINKSNNSLAGKGTFVKL